jgi:hypothetical protein
MFDILFFYIPHADERVAKTNYALMHLMLCSARAVGFDGEFIFYTHESARLPDDLPVSRTVRIAPDGVPAADVMLLKAYAHHHFVHSDLFTRPALSVEADQLFQASPMEAFDLPFDIGITYPHWAKEISGDFGKINGGVTYFNSEDIAAVRSYFSAYIATFLAIRDETDQRYPRRPRLAERGGGEITHLRMLPPHAFDDHGQERRCFTVAGARVMLLEAARFNCQQGERDGEDIVFRHYPDAIIRHFNGWRKKIIPEYAMKFLNLKMEPSDENSWGTRVIDLSPGEGKAVPGPRP